MSLRLTILGCHSATPRSLAQPSAQYLEINGEHLLIDCAEGTQSQLRKFGVKFSRIRHIFISHLHGDHFFGLIGLISTFSLLNRQNELNIYGPKGLKEIIQLQLKLTKSWIDYPLHFHELSSSKSETILDSDKIEVRTIPLHHRIYTNGFLFQEKLAPRKLNMEAISRHPEIEICDYQNLKDGKDFTSAKGIVLSNEELTLEPPPPLSYAYCSDTTYSEKVAKLVQNVDLLYHESTFLEQHVDLAETTRHSTAAQAAKIASMAGAKRLILGHFSSRYKDINLFLEEAQEHFPNCELCEAGKVFELDNRLV
jgi:ribonuclease Z